MSSQFHPLLAALSDFCFFYYVSVESTNIGGSSEEEGLEAGVGVGVGELSLLTALAGRPDVPAG